MLYTIRSAFDMAHFSLRLKRFRTSLADMPLILIVFWRDRCPETTSTSRCGTPRALEKNPTSARFAFPSTGGAVSLTRTISESRSESSFFRLLGWTLIRTVVPSDPLEKAG